MHPNPSRNSEAPSRTTTPYEFFFINRHPYFTTITGKLNYRTIRRCCGQYRKDILKRLQAIVARHTKRGFQVNEYHADNDFKKIEVDIVPSMLHTQAEGENEPTSEQNIGMIKDRTRSMVNSEPYSKIPLLIIDSI